jgi:putative acetyltransferase
MKPRDAAPAVNGRALLVRPEQAGDSPAIRAVHVAAFPTDAESRLVEALRASGSAVVSLIAELEGEPIGHVLFSPVSIELEPGWAGARGLGLAPLAVLPKHQRRGIGAELVRAGIAACGRAGVQFIVVLGNPDYYQRFGFRRARLAGLGNEYGADAEFMVLELQRGALDGARGTVKYGREFSMFEATSSGGGPLEGASL